MIETELRGVEGAIGNLKFVEKAMGRTTLNAIRRVVRKRVTRVRQAVRTESGMGSRIWGQNPVGLTKLVSLVRARLDAGGVTTGIKLKGLPMYIERGGQLRAHKIEPKKSGGVLANAAGGFIVRGAVNHPGSQVRPHGYAQAEIDSAEPEILREVDNAMRELVAIVRA